MARYPRSGLQPRSLAPPAEAGRPQGRGPVRADHLGRGPGRRSPSGSRRSPARPTGPQAILPYSYCGTMGKLQSSSLDRRFFHRWGPRSWTGRSAPRPARSATNTPWAAAGSGPTRWPCRECKFIVNWGSNTANTNSHLWSLMIEARKAGATIVTIDPYRSPTARAVRLAHPAPPRHRRRARPGPDARHLARRPPGRRLPRPRRPSAPSCSASASSTEYPPEKVAAITGVDVDDDRRRSPIAWPASSRR